jgi:putative phage-type endonuclease
MKTHNVRQGSPEWLMLRSQYLTASEAPAMLGLSKYQTRTQLLHQKWSGVAPEVDAHTQALFDQGHAAESAARELAETMLDEELYPATGTAEVDGLPLLASFDGLTIDDSQSFEHKLWNAAFAQVVAGGDLPDTHWPQVEQQLLVSGAEVCLFIISDGTPDKMASVYYRSIPERRARVIAGWKQFQQDLREYQPANDAPAAVAAPIESFPTLTVEITGSVTSSNLVIWQSAVQAQIQAISTDLQSDEDFATADKTVKFLDDAEKRVEVVKATALAQTASIDELFRALDAIKAEMRAKRLNLDKLVKARKESIREEIVRAGAKALGEHIAALNEKIGRPYMPSIPADFGGAVKNKRTVASLRDAVDTTLAQAKMRANEVADQIMVNLAALRHLGAGYESLFADTAAIVIKAPDDLVALISHRISAHKQQEETRLAAERERIRREEEMRARAQVEAEARAKQAADEAERRALAEEQRQRAAEEQRLRAEAAAVAVPAPEATALIATDSPPISDTKRQVLAHIEQLDEEGLYRVLRFIQSRYPAAA